MIQKRPETLVLGIDPGTAAMGFSFVGKSGYSLSLLDYGCITTTPKQTLPERLLVIYKTLKKIVKKHKPAVLAIEKLFFSKNVRTAMSVAQARGIALLVAAENSLEVFEYNPQQIKLSVTGWGGADKRQVQEMVKRILGLKVCPTPDDTADAIAVAICHLNTNNILSKYKAVPINKMTTANAYQLQGAKA